MPQLKIPVPSFPQDVPSTIRRISGQLCAKRWTIATAESCTAGLVANSLTQISGSSAYFLGAVVAYAAHRKVEVLGVDKHLIDTHGIVSEQVAAAMAAGACQLMASTIAVATTGVLGPQPEADGTAPGKLCLAIHHESLPGRTATVSLTGADRRANLDQANLAALQLIADFTR